MAFISISMAKKIVSKKTISQKKKQPAKPVKSKKSAPQKKVVKKAAPQKKAKPTPKKTASKGSFKKVVKPVKSALNKKKVSVKPTSVKKKVVKPVAKKTVKKVAPAKPTKKQVVKKQLKPAVKAKNIPVKKSKTPVKPVKKSKTPVKPVKKSKTPVKPVKKSASVKAKVVAKPVVKSKAVNKVKVVPVKSAKAQIPAKKQSLKVQVEKKNNKKQSVQINKSKPAPSKNSKVEVIAEPTKKKVVVAAKEEMKKIAASKPAIASKPPVAQIKTKPAKPGRRKKKSEDDDMDGPSMKDLEILDLPDFMVKPSKKDKKEPHKHIIRTPAVQKEVINQHKNEKVDLNPKVVRTNNKIKIELEYMVRSSPRILFNFISTPSGLSEWFSDDVNIKNDIYSFMWEGSEERARLLVAREFDLVRFKWVSTDNDDTYFELRIKIDELTGDVALIITDFALKEELQEVQMLWDTQIHELFKVLGT